MMGFGHAGFGMAHCGPPHHCAPPVRYCRREAKELLAVPGQEKPQVMASTKRDAVDNMTLAPSTEKTDVNINETKASTGQADAVIGGGCCVELAVEYMPVPARTLRPTAEDVARHVTVSVVDSEGTRLSWRKDFSEGYHVKESIIVTYPGATLHVSVSNAIARVRWCEVFSC
jgi:hypothetical protein